MKIKELLLDFIILLNVLVLPTLLPEMCWMKVCFEEFNYSHPLISWLTMIIPVVVYFKVASFLLPKFILYVFPKRFLDSNLEARYGTLTDEQATVFIVLLIGIGLIFALINLYI